MVSQTISEGAVDHEQLVQEMSSGLVERLTTQQRLKLARKRRKDQLRQFFAREKEWASSQQIRSDQTGGGRRRRVQGGVHFVDGVVLLEAAARNDVEEVRRLLESGVDPDSTNEDGLTALHQCCIDDSEAMMTVLLDHGANVDAEDSERWTPLHAAATCGHLHLVTQLVQRGANLLAVNADGNMPYDICEHNAALEYIETQMARRHITQELIEETRGLVEAAMLQDMQQRPDSRLEERSAQNATPLHVAAANGYVSVVEHLLERGVSVDARDTDLWQPVHAAACWGHPRVIELLYQHGADLTARTKHGETPFDVCEDPEIRERLEQLRTEQELKKTSEAQGRVRRTQSTKHSIRRTSMRQKNLTPKKDVKREAQIRLGVQGSLATMDDVERCLDSTSLQDITIHIPDSLARKCDGVDGPTPESKDNSTSANGEQTPTPLSIASVGAGEGAGDGSDSPLDPAKIDIHVHVTVNTSSAGGATFDPMPPPYSQAQPLQTPAPAPNGTLAQLKQQRAQLRTGGATSAVQSPPDGSTAAQPAPPAPPPLNGHRRYSGDAAAAAAAAAEPESAGRRLCCLLM